MPPGQEALPCEGVQLAVGGKFSAAYDLNLYDTYEEATALT